MENALKDWSEIAKNFLEGTAILVAAIWTIFRFGIFRERFAKIEFNLDCRYIGQTEENHIIELIAVIENKGLVRQNIKEWTFDLLVFKKGDKIDETESSINYQVKFFDKKISKRPWVPTIWYTTFIDAGTKQVYTYLTSVPNETKFITIYSRFIYPNTDDFHSSQRTFELESIAQHNIAKSNV
ncbi:hypothetical protein SAMN02745146_1969 [Hymenobacter daecheongensis DSM 21074]|uniref:Uncharacterized protein n=1 Tax=Hymenobacter daecheongensis DSM 21074 TaxID=1121955 RepID=A0A1M6F822_9BACT|nr:hypothetical protein [Hymenobacter daecheongensis]SHI93845.1 hypothetical protein SAMN02745146_1969 [Hymenobacter daecheongensis DSM 21074]